MWDNLCSNISTVLITSNACLAQDGQEIILTPRFYPVNEVKAGLEILKSLNLKNRGVKIISCPSCARQAFEVIKTVEILEQRLSHIKEPLTLSIIGCVVNGPGEASQTDIGLTGGGKGNNMIYLSGLQDHKVPSEKIIEHIVGLVEKKAEQIRNQAL